MASCASVHLLVQPVNTALEQNFICYSLRGEVRSYRPTVDELIQEFNVYWGALLDAFRKETRELCPQVIVAPGNLEYQAIKSYQDQDLFPA